MLSESPTCPPAAIPAPNTNYRFKGHGFRPYLHYDDLARQDIEWLGVLYQDRGSSGALGRIKSSGLLVMVNAGRVRELNQDAVKAAMAAVG